MPINQISTANTFQQWLIATQQLINSHNYYEEDFTNLSDNANLVFDTANNTTNVYNLTVNTYNDTVNTYNTIVLYVDTAYDTANSALETANLALETANSISYDTFNVFNELASTQVHYPLMANTVTGIPTKLFSSQLSFYPSNNQLTFGNTSFRAANTNSNKMYFIDGPKTNNYIGASIDGYFDTLNSSSYNYDANNNITQIIFTTGNKLTVSYPTNQIITNYYDTNGSTLLATYTAIFHANGNISSTSWS